MKGTIVELSLGLFGLSAGGSEQGKAALGQGQAWAWEEQLLFVVHYGRWLKKKIWEWNEGNISADLVLQYLNSED